MIQSNQQIHQQSRKSRSDQLKISQVRISMRRASFFVKFQRTELQLCKLFCAIFFDIIKGFHSKWNMDRESNRAIVKRKAGTRS
ncbi:unnamed protein product, partial [Mesorhabditis belari]|uniref:Uncharacterized protein n=1 Tax=Mesorhabditis belari TaxID=2138241 RepID=A0AAF3ES97_9BILA